MNRMRNSQLLDFNITGENNDSLNVIADAYWKNPSVVELQIGYDASFQLSYKNSVMGSVLAPDIHIGLEANVLHLFGHLKPENLTVASELISDYLRGEATTVTCTGTAINTDNQSIPWLQQMIQQLQLTTSMPGLSNFTFVRDILMEKLGIQFVSNDLILGNATVNGAFQ